MIPELPTIEDLPFHFSALARVASALGSLEIFTDGSFSNPESQRFEEYPSLIISAFAKTKGELEFVVLYPYTFTASDWHSHLDSTDAALK